MTSPRESAVRRGRAALARRGALRRDQRLPNATAPSPSRRYRDYVIRSFNDDKPATQFVKEQLAGDEMLGSIPTPSPRRFYRLGIWDDDGRPLAFEVTTTSLRPRGRRSATMPNCARRHDRSIPSRRPITTRWSRLPRHPPVLRTATCGPRSTSATSPARPAQAHEEELRSARRGSRRSRRRWRRSRTR